MFQIEFENPGIIEKFALAPEVLQRETTNWLVDMAMWSKSDLQRRVPVKTGALKNSVRYELSHTPSGGEATFHSLGYGQWLDEGTKPFTIQASNGKPMAFSRGSDKIFAMKVNNPGIKARNFTLETLEAAHTEADRYADNIASRIWGVII